MTTERQRAANKRNAALSKGPASASGRRASSQNARKHGLNTSPEQADIMRWFRVITNDAEATLPSHLPDASEQAALRLAEAEAHLERTRAAERAHLEKMLEIAARRSRDASLLLVEVPREEWFEDEDILDLFIEDYSSDHMEWSKRAYFVSLLKHLRRTNPNRPAKLTRRMQTLRGYRKRAEGRRNRAFKDWQAALKT